jgi:hypothetical protein
MVTDTTQNHVVSVTIFKGVMILLVTNRPNLILNIAVSSNFCSDHCPRVKHNKGQCSVAAKLKIQVTQNHVVSVTIFKGVMIIL